jgi:hypothetical protein
MQSLLDLLDNIAAARREIAHVSELTGLSALALIGLGVLVYLDPVARKFAVRTALAVAVLYGACIYTYRLGATDVRAECHAADVAAAKAREVQDVSIDTELGKEFPPAPPAAEGVTQDERDTIAAISAAAAGACRLGADALRLRNHK